MGGDSLILAVRKSAQARYEITTKPLYSKHSAFDIQLLELGPGYFERRVKGCDPYEACTKAETKLYWQYRVLRTLRNMVNENTNPHKAARLFKRLKSAALGIDSFDHEKPISRALDVSTLMQMLCFMKFQEQDLVVVNLFLSDFLPINTQVFMDAGARESFEGSSFVTHSFWLEGKKVGSMRLVESPPEEPPSPSAILEWIDDGSLTPRAFWLDAFSLSIPGSMVRRIESAASAPVAHVCRMLKQMKMDAAKLLEHISGGMRYSSPGMREGDPPIQMVLQSDLCSLPPENFSFRIFLDKRANLQQLSTEARVLLGRSGGQEYILVPSFPDSIVAIHSCGAASDRLELGGMYSLLGSFTTN